MLHTRTCTMQVCNPLSITYPHFYHHSPRQTCYYLLACSEVCTQPGLALSSSVGSQVPQGQVRSFKGKRFMSSKQATWASAASHTPTCIILGFFPRIRHRTFMEHKFCHVDTLMAAFGDTFLVLFRLSLIIGFVDLSPTQVCLRPKWRELKQIFGDGAYHARG